MARRSRGIDPGLLSGCKLCSRDYISEVLPCITNTPKVNQAEPYQQPQNKDSNTVNGRNRVHHYHNGGVGTLCQVMEATEVQWHQIDPQARDKKST